MTPPGPRLAIFCRAPRPGRTKTRLAPGMGASAAAAFSLALLLDLAERLADPAWERELWVADARDRAAIAALVPATPVRVQAGGDLGERMSSCIATGVDEGRPATVIVGSDCPTIQRDTIRSALAALDDADAVICPGRDGGYGLVAARAAAPALFSGIDWGTGEVTVQTRAAARAAKLVLAEPCAADDVDRPADLARLARELARAGNPSPLGRTRAVIARADPS